MRRKLALMLGILALFAVAGGAVGAFAAFGGSDQPAQRSAALAQENRGARQRGDHAGRPTGAGESRGSARPLLAVVGASFSAGVGAGHPSDAWPEDLAQMMHWNLALSADPGAGYVNPGAGHRGPFSRLAARLHLARTHPQTIIIQGGHDDIGRPLPLIKQQVESLVATIRREAPRARLAILTVFPRGSAPSGPAWATDQAIVAAARHTDPAIEVFDPLASHWRFPRIGDHLHPTLAGHRWIAERLAAGLRGHQIAA